MKQMIRRVPLPLSGVMLGTAALGNLLQSVSEALRGICGCLAVMMLVLLLAKLILFPKQFRDLGSWAKSWAFCSFSIPRSEEFVNT